jgi:hypothetical protein
VDPNAELTVGEGEVRVTISRFSLSHDTFQSADSLGLVDEPWIDSVGRTPGL